VLRSIMRGGEGVNPKPSVHGSVLGMPCELAVTGDAGRWVQVNGMEVVGGLRVRQCEAEGRDWAKNPKPSICGSGSGVPYEMAGWGDAGRWRVRVNGMEAVGGLRVRQREAEGRDLGQKPKTERL
jgi:hypothetical protein